MIKFKTLKSALFFTSLVSVSSAFAMNNSGGGDNDLNGERSPVVGRKLADRQQQTADQDQKVALPKISGDEPKMANADKKFNGFFLRGKNFSF